MEKFIEGDVYRATLVNHKMAVCCMREAPNVVGDGINTIAELIKIKTSIRGAGKLIRKFLHLHKISAGENARLFDKTRAGYGKRFAERNYMPPSQQNYFEMRRGHSR